MKRPYEMTVILRIQSDDEMQQALDQVVAWIENSPEMEDVGQVTKIDRNLLGRRRLEYEIDGQRDGHYVVIDADVDPRHLPELETNLKLYDGVLRYGIFRDEEAEQEAEETEAQTEE